MDGQHYNEPASMATTRWLNFYLRVGANLDLQDKVRMGVYPVKLGATLRISDIY